MTSRWAGMGARRFVIVVLGITALLSLPDVASAIDGTITSTVPNTTTTTECQDHALGCGGQPAEFTTTTPTLDPADKDTTEIEDGLSIENTTTTVTLPRTT